jgi:hypothetical protein
MSGEPDELERLRAENAELRAKVWMLERDLSIIGPENVKLSNAYAAARVEIARLAQPQKVPNRWKKDGTPRQSNRGRNLKTYSGT